MVEEKESESPEKTEKTEGNKNQGEFNKTIEQIKTCEKCQLCKTRTNAVPGSGNPDADILFIGEAPGSNEDEQGLPFVGRAGKILDDLLISIELSRGDIYIANILKCRPPGNRNPKEEEINLCSGYLDKQISLIKPKVICCLGNFATRFILEKFNLKDEITGISKLHGKKFEISTLQGKINIIPLYHPAVATYNPNRINELKEDFQVLKDLV